MTCSTLVIAHGESEEIMARNIASRMRSQVEVYRNGGGAIRLEQIGGLLEGSPFVSEKSLHSRYPSMDYCAGASVKMKDLTIIPILDRESTDRHWKSYLSGNAFRNSPFKDRIIPVLNVENLDDIMEWCGYGKVADKTRYYRKLFSSIDVVDLYDRLLDCPDTNLEEFVFHLMKSRPPYQGRIENGTIRRPDDRPAFIRRLTR